MSKMTLGSHPFLLGFDQLERMLEQAEKSGTEGYPPFNIEQVSPVSIASGKRAVTSKPNRIQIANPTRSSSHLPT